MIGATALLGAGVAHAVVAEPSAGAHQLCGTVYSGAPLADNHPSPDSGVPDNAVPAEGVQVVGTLVPSTGTPTTFPAVATNSSGQYCLQGNAGLVATILGGGHVTLTTAGVTPIAVSHPTGIYQADFQNHQVGLTGATGFNIVVP
ncbi:hypothetical protein ACFWPA_01660 [Rhodococcus sp. NPDC058505]|uniref:hypothetical protein n=1 Tax=unclassified Rhodococcus (in: high G+C Gram-positive bacteria) TaxID=192944 RepID=UPI003654100C